MLNDLSADSNVFGSEEGDEESFITTCEQLWPDQTPAKVFQQEEKKVNPLT